MKRRFAALRRYRALLDEAYPEKVTAARLRGMACRTIKGFPGSALLREAVTRTRGSDELLAVVDAFRREPRFGSPVTEAAA